MWIALIVIILLIWHCEGLTRPLKSLKRRQHQHVALRELYASAKASERLFEKDQKAMQALSSLEESPLEYRTSEEDELAAMRYTDVAMADNFYEGTFPRTKGCAVRQ